MSEENILSKTEQLKNDLFMQKKNGYFRIDENEVDLAFDFAEGYKKFLNSSKTERLCVKNILKMAIDAGVSCITENIHLTSH